MKWKVGRHEVDGCPQKLLTPERIEAITVWRNWKRFGAPLSGGWAEWPARLVDLLAAFDNEITLEEQRRKEEGDG